MKNLPSIRTARLMPQRSALQCVHQGLGKEVEGDSCPDESLYWSRPTTESAGWGAVLIKLAALAAMFAFVLWLAGKQGG